MNQEQVYKDALKDSYVQLKQARKGVRASSANNALVLFDVALEWMDEALSSAGEQTQMEELREWVKETIAATKESYRELDEKEAHGKQIGDIERSVLMIITAGDGRAKGLEAALDYITEQLERQDGDEVE